MKQTKRTTPLLDVAQFELVYIDGYYRYVNHKGKLLTTGFPTTEAMAKYSNSFLATREALAICHQRYIDTYGE